VCELAGEIETVGAIKRVKVLGTFAVIDEGETDWKIVVVDATNPLAGRLNDISDVETHMPGYLATMQEWFRLYKVPEGKRKNDIAMNGELKGRE
jgi:inorganic pyrophosphatase